LILLKNPLFLKTFLKNPKCSQVEESPGLVERGFSEGALMFWWCFRLFLFDHLGLFSRISFVTLKVEDPRKQGLINGSNRERGKL
jgi:hypothetical protein